MTARMLEQCMCSKQISHFWLQEDRKTHYEALKKENDVLIGKINANRAAQAQQEPNVAKVVI